MDVDESRAEATRILSEAGWTADAGWGSFFHGPCIGGIAPDGNVYVKNIAAIQPGHPKYGPDTPDEFHEAALWLAARYKAPKAPPQPPEASIPVDALEYRMPAHLSADYLAEPPEASETPQDETHGETGEEADGAEGAQGGLAGEQLSGAVAQECEDVDGAAGASVSGEDTEVHGTVDFGDDKPALIDADFTLDTIELIEPEPDPDFGSDLLEYESEKAAAPEAPASGAFIFGDNLHQMRTAAIGLVSTHAAILTAEIEAASGEQEGEYADLQSFVVTNLDKHTGAFTLQDAPSLMRYHRWSELDATRAAVRTIDRVRKEKTAFLLSAERAEIEAFDPEDGWP